MSVAGFDDQIIASYLNPSLTTMEIPLHEIGRRSAALLVEKITEKNGEKADEEHKKGAVIKMPCSFIERNSVSEI